MALGSKAVRECIKQLVDAKKMISGGASQALTPSQARPAALVCSEVRFVDSILDPPSGAHAQYTLAAYWAAVNTSWRACLL